MEETTQLQSSTRIVDRPRPPHRLIDPDVFSIECFVPAPDLARWLRDNFIEEDGPLWNEDHKHLSMASIGVVWTNAANSKGGINVVGMAEMPMPRGNAWQQARQEQQLEQWFGRVPDFLLTFYAPYCDEVCDATFCALVEHELYHCAQAKDVFGLPKFRRDGKPIFSMRGHDVEEFVGVVSRYGAGHAAGMTKALVQAANDGPTIAAARISHACGTCR